MGIPAPSKCSLTSESKLNSHQKKTANPSFWDLHKVRQSEGPSEQWVLKLQSHGNAGLGPPWAATRYLHRDRPLSLFGRRSHKTPVREQEKEGSKPVKHISIMGKCMVPLPKRREPGRNVCPGGILAKAGGSCSIYPATGYWSRTAPTGVDSLELLVRPATKGSRCWQLKHRLSCPVVLSTEGIRAGQAASRHELPVSKSYASKGLRERERERDPQQNRADAVRASALRSGNCLRSFPTSDLIVQPLPDPHGVYPSPVTCPTSLSCVDAFVFLPSFPRVISNYRDTESQRIQLSFLLTSLHPSRVVLAASNGNLHR